MRPIRDHFLHAPSLYFDYAHAGFEMATRVEMHVLPGLAFEIEFFDGRKSTKHKIVFSIDENGDFGAGFTGGTRIR